MRLSKLGFLKALLQENTYHLSREQANEIYMAFAEMEIDRSDSYIELYESARKNNDEEAVMLAHEYILGSLHFLGNIRQRFKSNRTPQDVVDRVETQIRRLLAYLP